MCNCPEDKASPQKEPVTPKNDNQLSPQGASAEQQRETRQKKPCCKTKRVLTYEDETIIPGQCRDDNVIALPPPCPRRASPMRHCDLSGIAVVRRRIDTSTSPERKADTSKKDTAAESLKSDADKVTEKDKNPEKAKDPEAAGEKGKESAEDKKDGEDKPKESESPPAPSGEPQPAAEASVQMKDKEAKDIVTSTPCPGKLNPNNECNCSPVPKIA
ncbi:uncharacterized protein LOC100123839 [Nasonia vitripennis]|uniref:Uncharacterized protein n=1 Tax=Nasonia vitripennis TaxID=7425 RepID=A0A7M7LJY4_NASVI|nr:uncharacterized protein LOC100123839 [Nasonia vitripennis]